MLPDTHTHTHTHIYIYMRKKWQPTPDFLDWKIPWTKEAGGLQTMGLQLVGHK